MIGPYVHLALFCEEARFDQESKLWVRQVYGACSAVQIGDAPGIRGTAYFSTRLLGGGLNGVHELTLSCEAAKVALSWEAPFYEEADDVPFDLLNWPVEVRVLGFGTYWFDLAIDGRLLTRVPLRIFQADSPLGL